jgi:hypothetical protein
MAYFLLRASMDSRSAREQPLARRCAGIYENIDRHAQRSKAKVWLFRRARSRRGSVQREDVVRSGARREDKLTPADVRGGTFTISNHGVSGSLVATPIVINQPQSAILGIGKLEKRAVVVDDNGTDKIVVQPRCYVTLTLDHRVMDGHRANRFLQVLVQRLANWRD